MSGRERRGPVEASGAPLEFSRIIDTAKVERAPKTFRFQATEVECKRLAERLGIPAVESLDTEIVVRRAADGRSYKLHGSLSATVVQECVVTLEPVALPVQAEFDMVFAPPGRSSIAATVEDDGGEVWIGALGEDPPEPLLQGRIEAGELVVEELALALDPYPRAPGAEMPAAYRDVEGPVAGEEERRQPFAALESLVKKL